MSCFDNCEHIDLPIEKLKLQSKALQNMLHSPLRENSMENDKENVNNISMAFQSPPPKSNKRDSHEVVDIVQSAGLPSVLKRLKKDHLLSDLKKRGGNGVGTPAGGKQSFHEGSSVNHQDDQTQLESYSSDTAQISFETKNQLSHSKKSPVKSPVKSGSKFFSKKTQAATRTVSPFSKLGGNSEQPEQKPEWKKYTSRTSFPPKIQPLKKIISNLTAASKQNKTPPRVSPPHVDIKRIKSEYEQNVRTFIKFVS